MVAVSILPMELSSLLQCEGRRIASPASISDPVVERASTGNGASWESDLFALWLFSQSQLAPLQGIFRQLSCLRGEKL